MASTDTDRDSQTSKSARFEARISAEQKSLFLKAATLTGRSLTDFVVASLVLQCHKTPKHAPDAAFLSWILGLRNHGNPGRTRVS